MRELAKDNPNRLAALAEQEGRAEDASALYTKLAEHGVAKAPSDVWQALSPLNSLARVYEQDQRYADAVTVLRRAITLVDGRPETGWQNVKLRQQLAIALQQTGQADAAEQAYLQAIVLAPAFLRFQMLHGYASFLGETGRGEQGMQLLQDYLARGGPMQEWEESSARMMLSQLARQSGNTKLAKEYQKAAIAKQPRSPGQNERITLNPYMQRANAAASNRSADEAFAITLEAMNAAGHAADRESIVSLVWSIANGLAAWTPSDPKAAEKGRQLFDRLFVLVDGWSDQTRRPQIEARERYFQFVRGPFRGGKMGEDALARYREVLIAARGESTGWMEQVLQLKLQLPDLGERSRRLSVARELVELEEALSGATSEPYLRAVQTLAITHENAGDLSDALRLRMQAVAIADLVSEPGDSRRGYTRTQAAYTLARLGRFDEAEKLIDEAMAIKLRPPQPNLFQSQAEEIQRMKLAAQRPK
jgi:tetratricopeptide (TPR) repeat protein